MKPFTVTMLVLAVSLFSATSCKKKSDPAPTDETPATATTTTTTTDTITTNTLSALPADLAIASNTEAVSVTTAKLMAQSGTQTAGKQDAKAKKERLKKATNATTKADCFAMISGMAAPMKSPSCYGPSVFYTKHPDHTTPSSGASTLASCPTGASPGDASGCLPGGDLGIWDAAETDGTACAAAKLNSVVQTASQSIDLGVGATAAMLCIAKLSKLQMPAIGKTLDLAPTLKADADVKAKMTVTVASITREADTTAGRPVYTSNMELAITPPGAQTANNLSLKLRHVPLDSKNATYKGLMTMVRVNGAGAPPKPPEPPKTTNIAGPLNLNLGAGDLNAVSVIYHKTATSLTYKVVTANYGPNAKATTIFNSTTGEVNAALGGDGTTGWKGNLNLMVGTSDDKGDGSLAVAWQAGSNDGFTRNFNITTLSNADGSRTGSAYFGFAKNTNNTAPKLAIEGMICNWAGPNNQRASAAGWNLVQKQTMKLNTTSGIWAPVTSNITFAPTNSCNWTNVTDSTYSKTAITTATTKGAVTNNLVTKASGYSFTVPTAPTAP